jgi:hypothetical protein
MPAQTRYRFSLLCARYFEAVWRNGDASCGSEGRRASWEARRRLRIVWEACEVRIVLVWIVRRVLRFDTRDNKLLRLKEELGLLFTLGLKGGYLGIQLRADGIFGSQVGR